MANAISAIDGFERGRLGRLAWGGCPCLARAYDHGERGGDKRRSRISVTAQTSSRSNELLRIRRVEGEDSRGSADHPWSRGPSPNERKCSLARPGSQNGGV